MDTPIHWRWAPSLSEIRRQAAIKTGGPLMTHHPAAIRFVGGNRVEALAVRYGTPAEVDSYGDYFTPNTNFWIDGQLSWPRPMLLEHTVDAADPGAALVGRWLEARRAPEGVVLVGELDPLHPRYPATRADLEAGRMFLSTDSAPHLVRRRRASAGAREVTTWPILGASLTRNPAERRLTPAALKAAYQQLFAAAPVAKRLALELELLELEGPPPTMRAIGLELDLLELDIRQGGH
jgi:hypothetical protein